MAQKEAPCLYCDETFVFVAAAHLETHFGDSNAFNRYKEWLADEHGIDSNHEVFHTPGALTRAEDFEDYKHLFD
ncbi:hypothetical protein [Halorubellus litoreus]|uniref:C2H2-type domain-containing protein n=1 Tax=Halorubellus litoreus TaxID=755308 RepID=A0ABD5VDP7_9EURY